MYWQSVSRSRCVNACVLFCLRGGMKAPADSRVEIVHKQVAVPFEREMSYPEASNFEEIDSTSDQDEDFSSETLDVLALMETVRRVSESMS